MSMHSMSMKYWNSSPSKEKCLSYIDMTPWIELGCALSSDQGIKFLGKVLTFCYIWTARWRVTFFQSSNQSLAFKLVDVIWSKTRKMSVQLMYAYQITLSLGPSFEKTNSITMNKSSFHRLQPHIFPSLIFLLVNAFVFFSTNELC